MNNHALRDAVAYAPRVKNTNPEIRGFWSRDGYYLCADCGARLIGRGFGSELKTVVYMDDTLRGACPGCEPLRDENGDLL